MTLVTYPLDNTDYSMEDAALFHCTRTTGIYADNDFTFSVSGTDNTITLGVGIAWMRMSRFKGVVAALKTETAVNLGLPDPVYPRIDHVVIQYDANKNVTEIVVKNGTAASNPQPPERSTSEALYEIHLAEVRREPGATAVTARNVTDLRLNENYCGIMAESVTKVDTAAINAQVTALIQALQAEIDAVKAGTAYLMKSGDTMTGDLNMGGHAIIGAELTQIVQATLTAAGWSANAPYTQTVAVAGVTAGSPPYITPVYSGVTDADIALREACAAVSYAKPGPGTITFVCLEDKPQTNIPVQVLYLGYYAGEIDGIWGNNSRCATEAFQRNYGLTVDGIFGIGTEARIREVVASGELPQQPQDTPETEGGADWWKDIRYFKRAEFRCPCGRCGGFPVEPQESIARTVDEIRYRLGIPISIVDGGGSGVRCAAHNAEVGGVANSQHLYGLAADLHSAASPAQMKAVAEDVMGRTGGIGLYDWGIHVDTRPGYARWNG